MDTERIRKRLLVVRIVAILDALLLVVLLYGFVTDAEVHKEILGPVHGGGWILLIVLTGLGAQQRLWAWWFPLITVITAGPPGSLIGDVIISRQIRS